MITVCGEISLFQIVDNSRGMYFSTTQTGLCHNTKHLLYPSWQRVETVLMLPPSCLSQTRGRCFIITRRLTVRRSEVHARDSTSDNFHPTFPPSLMSSFQVSVHVLVPWHRLHCSPFSQEVRVYLRLVTVDTDMFACVGRRTCAIVHMSNGHFINIWIKGIVHMGGLVFVPACQFTMSHLCLCKVCFEWI